MIGYVDRIPRVTLRMPCGHTVTRAAKRVVIGGSRDPYWVRCPICTRGLGIGCRYSTYDAAEKEAGNGK